jgi:hypothetical protein
MVGSGGWAYSIGDSFPSPSFTRRPQSYDWGLLVFVLGSIPACCNALRACLHSVTCTPSLSAVWLA